MTAMGDSLETSSISWSRRSKTAAGQPVSYSLVLKDVANRVDSELNRSILLGMTLPAQRSANLHQPQGEIFSEDRIKHESFL
jgi:hypothetical protein